MAASWMSEVPGFRDFAREVILDSAGWAKPLGLEKAMRSYFDGDRLGYCFPHPLSIFSIVAWRLLLLNLWSRHYLSGRNPCLLSLNHSGFGASAQLKATTQ